MSFDKRFYGIYQGLVVDNQDPEGRGRVTVQVPQVTGQAVTDWVDVCNTGGVISPNPGDAVWVMYIAGDPNFPVWMGVLK
jgi:hypothetical protein